MRHPTIRHTMLVMGFVAAFAAAGCGDADDTAAKAKFTIANFEPLVMARSDLPDGYKVVRRKRFSSAASCLASLSDSPFGALAVKKKLAGPGLLGCWRSSFIKEVSVGNDGTLLSHEPDSAAILMRDEQAASKTLRAVRRALSRSLTSSGSPVEAHSIPAPGLGNEAPRGISFGDGVVHLYIWRRANVIAWTMTSNVLNDLDQRAALKLARKIDRRGAA